MKNISENIDLSVCYNSVWEDLEDAVKNRRSDYRVFQLASVFYDKNNQSWQPSIRSVVLRGVSVDKKTLIFHCDKRSEKLQHILNNKHVSVHFYCKNDKIQMRFSAIAEQVLNQSDVLERWKKTQALSRRCYMAKAPKTNLAIEETALPDNVLHSQPSIEESDYAIENFSVIELRLLDLDYLLLNFSEHKRFIVSDLKNPKIQKVAP